MRTVYNEQTGLYERVYEEQDYAVAELYEYLAAKDPAFKPKHQPPTPPARPANHGGAQK